MSGALADNGLNNLIRPRSSFSRRGYGNRVIRNSKDRVFVRLGSIRHDSVERTRNARHASFELITRHSHVWHWYIQRSPLLKTRWWSSWCLQDALGLHWGQHVSLWLSGALQSHMGSLQVITPSWHVHLLQVFSAGVKVSPLLTSRPSYQQPGKSRICQMMRINATMSSFSILEVFYV